MWTAQTIRGRNLGFINYHHLTFQDMNPLTPERLAEIEKRCNAATAGDKPVIRYDDLDAVGRIRDRAHHAAIPAPERADLFAILKEVDEARTDIPDLLSEIKRLREQLSRKPEYTCREEKCGGCYDCLLLQARFIADQLEKELNQLRAQLSDAQGRVSELTDLLDLAHDEFQRIEAVADEAEITGIALRGQAKIRQNVPVIRQRDELENAVIKLDGLNDQLRAQLSDARAALKVAIDAIENVQADHNEPTSNDGADYRPCDCEICKINTAALQPKE
jgi:DNA repair exonuclease SbcCD ATPase subunit